MLVPAGGPQRPRLESSHNRLRALASPLIRRVPLPPALNRWISTIHLLSVHPFLKTATLLRHPPCCASVVAPIDTTILANKEDSLNI